MQLFYFNMVVSFSQEINEFFRFLRYKTPRRISKTQRGDDFHLYNKVLGDVFLKLLALDQLLAAYKENEWTAVLFQHRVNAVYTDAGIDAASLIVSNSLSLIGTMILSSIAIPRCLYYVYLQKVH